MEVRIEVCRAGKRYSVEREYPEMNIEAWGSNTDYVDVELDLAVDAIKRAYRSPDVQVP